MEMKSSKATNAQLKQTVTMMGKLLKTQREEWTQSEEIHEHVDSSDEERLATDSSQPKLRETRLTVCEQKWIVEMRQKKEDIQKTVERRKREVESAKANWMT